MSITTSMTVDPDSWELFTARTYKHSFISIEMTVTPTANSVITIRWEWMNETESKWDVYRFSVQYLPESVGMVQLRIEDASENEIHPGSLFEIPRGVTQTYLKLWFSSSGIDQWVMFSVIVNSDHFKIRLPEQSSDWQNEVSQDMLDMSLKETAFVHLDILVEQPGNTTLTVHWSQVDVGGNQWTHNPPYTININALGGEPQIPGFSFGAILIGLFIAFMAVIVIRRRRTHVIND